MPSLVAAATEVMGHFCLPNMLMELRHHYTCFQARHCCKPILKWSLEGWTSCLFSPFTNTQCFSQGFLLALSLLLSTKWPKHSQTSTTHFELEGLPLKIEVFFYISHQGRRVALVTSSQHSTVHETAQKAEEFPFAQLPVLPCSSHGEHF